jgi:hypothetical protein
MTTLLEIVQSSCRLLSLLPPDEVVTSTDAQVQLLYELANEEGDELSSNGDKDWPVLTEEWSFTTVADAVQVDAVPTDMDHFIPNSFFNRTTRLQMLGPLTPQQWQAIQAQPQLNLVYLAYRERDGAFLITPPPAAGNEIYYEYVTKNWVRAANGDLKSSFTADSDEPRMGDKLFRLGIRWRFLKSKGLDYSQDFDTYQRQVQTETARVGGSTMLDITGKSVFNAWGFPNLPLGNFPS